MKTHRAPGRARMPSKRSIAAFVAFLIAMALILVAVLIGWLPRWTSLILHGAVFACYLPQLPRALRELRGSIPRLDPDYRRAKRR